MTSYVALLRAVNVGGTGKLPMAELRAMGEACGFAHCRTFIASGNLLFDSELGERAVRNALEARLGAYAAKPVAVQLRSAAELAAIVAADPFPDAVGSQHMVIFGAAAPPADLLASARHVQGERIVLGRREVHVDYGRGISDSKLKLALDATWTMRNMNSVRKLALLAAG